MFHEPFAYKESGESVISELLNLSERGDSALSNLNDFLRKSCRNAGTEHRVGAESREIAVVDTNHVDTVAI